MTSNDPEAMIGLEVHVQLLTERKLFCGDRVEFGAPPNTHVCPVCLGLPGALPVLNGEAVEPAVKAALALGCRVHERSVFSRKHYFYPDLPKGYQITQYAEPLATGGALEVEADGRPVRARIRRLHLEEDAGKSLHDRVPGATAVDLNRAGVPLIEIVTEPDLTSPADARSWLGGLRRILEYLEVSDCNMEEGSLRVDANVSLAGREDGERTELKNMNSFAAVERALAFEIERRRAAVQEGRSLEGGTRTWDPETGTTLPLRTKEEAADYRYFDEPDLPPLAMDPRRTGSVGASLPELPDERRRRLVDELGLPPYDAGVLTARRELADYFEALVAHAPDPKAASNWVLGPVLREVNETGGAPADLGVSAEDLGALLWLVERGEVSRTAADAVFRRMLVSRGSPREIVDRRGLGRVHDPGTLTAWVEEALAAHPDEAARLSGGEERLVGFFMGEVMARSGGRADPPSVRSILEALASDA